MMLKPHKHGIVNTESRKPMSPPEQDDATPNPDAPAQPDEEREALIRRFDAIMERNQDVFRRLAEDD